MTELELEEIEHRALNTTHGKWKVLDNRSYDIESTSGNPEDKPMVVARDMWRGDAYFVVGAKRDVLLLLAEVRALRVKQESVPARIKRSIKRAYKVVKSRIEDPF